MIAQAVNWDYQWGQIVGRAWADEDFKQRLLADPMGVLEEFDLAPPVGCRIEVLDDTDQVPEDTEGVIYLVLPARPSAAELSEDDLCSGGAVAGERCGCGGCHHCGGCGGCGGCVVACVWCYHSPQPDAN